jgi:hypothetical protein
MDFAGSFEKCSASRTTSASFMSLTIGSIWGEGRSSSRIRTSWVSMKSFGCPAIKGMPAVTELPSGPWHARQGSWERTEEAKRAVSSPAILASLPSAPTRTFTTSKPLGLLRFHCY